MTTPSGGYPDFQSYASFKGTPIVAPLTARAAGTFTIGDMNLGNYGSLNAFIKCTAGNGELSIKWWTDSTKTTLVDTHLIPIVANTTIDLALPTLSSFVTIAINVVSVGGMTEAHMMTPSNAIPPYIVNLSIPDPAGRTAKSLAASAVDTLLVDYVVPGNAFLSFTPADATGKLQVQVQSIDKTNSASFTLFNDPGPTSKINTPLLLPYAPCQLVITNTDGAGPHTYTATLLPLGH